MRRITESEELTRIATLLEWDIAGVLDYTPSTASLLTESFSDDPAAVDSVVEELSRLLVSEVLSARAVHSTRKLIATQYAAEAKALRSWLAYPVFACVQARIKGRNREVERWAWAIAALSHENQTLISWALTEEMRGQYPPVVCDPEVAELAPVLAAVVSVRLPAARALDDRSIQSAQHVNDVERSALLAQRFAEAQQLRAVIDRSTKDIADVCQYLPNVVHAFLAFEGGRLPLWTRLRLRAQAGLIAQEMSRSLEQTRVFRSRLEAAQKHLFDLQNEYAVVGAPTVGGQMKSDDEPRAD